jgi:hypothetical protein
MSYHIPSPSEVWKHKLPLQEMFNGRESLVRLQLPAQAQIIHFAQQGGEYYIWEAHQIRYRDSKVESLFLFTGTGHEIPGWLLILRHIGTTLDNFFVWHLFEVSDQRNNMEPS